MKESRTDISQQQHNRQRVTRKKERRKKQGCSGCCCVLDRVQLTQALLSKASSKYTTSLWRSVFGDDSETVDDNTSAKRRAYQIHTHTYIVQHTTKTTLNTNKTYFKLFQALLQLKPNPWSSQLDRAKRKICVTVVREETASTPCVRR